MYMHSRTSKEDEPHVLSHYARLDMHESDAFRTTQSLAMVDIYNLSTL